MNKASTEPAQVPIEGLARWLQDEAT